MARKIFVGNYKGGVGKTTFTYNIGCELHKRKEKVLLIDLDPQSSLTEVCYGVSDYGNFENLSDEETFNNIIDLYCNANRSNIFDRLNLDINKLVKDNGLVKFIPSSYLYKNGGLDIQCLNMKKKSTDMLIIKRFIEDSKVAEKLEKGKQSEIAQFPKLLDEIIDRIESIEKEENK